MEIRQLAKRAELKRLFSVTSFFAIHEFEWNREIEQNCVQQKFPAIQKLINFLPFIRVWKNRGKAGERKSLRLWMEINFYQFHLFFKSVLRSILTITYRSFPFAIALAFNHYWRCSRKCIQHKKKSSNGI